MLLSIGTLFYADFAFTCGCSGLPLFLCELAASTEDLHKVLFMTGCIWLIYVMIIFESHSDDWAFDAIQSVGVVNEGSVHAFGVFHP